MKLILLSLTALLFIGCETTEVLTDQNSHERRIIEENTTPGAYENMDFPFFDYNLPEPRRNIESREGDAPSNIERSYNLFCISYPMECL